MELIELTPARRKTSTVIMSSISSEPGAKSARAVFDDIFRAKLNLLLAEANRCDVNNCFAGRNFVLNIRERDYCVIQLTFDLVLSMSTYILYVV